MRLDSFMSELLEGMPRGDLPTPLRHFHNRVIAVVGAESFEELETRKSQRLRDLRDLRSIRGTPVELIERLKDNIEKETKPSHYSKTLRSICLESGFPLLGVRFYATWDDFDNDSLCNPDIIFFDGHGYSGKPDSPFDEPRISNGYEVQETPKEEETHPIEKILQWINEKKGSIFLIFLPICDSNELAGVLRQSDKVKHVFGPDHHSIFEFEHEYRLDSIRLLFEEWFAE